MPPEHTVARYVPWARLRRDGDDNVVGVLPQAFSLRDDEEYLSATWLEYFSGTRDQQLLAMVSCIRNSKLAVKPKSGFALGNVAEISDACSKIGVKIRVIHEREDDNEAHTALRRWPADNPDLLTLIADEIWNDIVLNKDIAA